MTKFFMNWSDIAARFAQIGRRRRAGSSVSDHEQREYLAWLKIRKHGPRNAKMQAVYDAAFSEALEGGITRGKAHSYALGKVESEFKLSGRQVRRIIQRN